MALKTNVDRFLAGNGGKNPSVIKNWFMLSACTSSCG